MYNSELGCYLGSSRCFLCRWAATSWVRSKALGFALPMWKGWSCLLASSSVLYGECKMWVSLSRLKWTLFTPKCSGDSDSWLVLLWPDLSEICAPAAVSVCSVSLQALLAMSCGEPQTQCPHWSPNRHPVTKLWGLFCPGAGGGLICLSYCCCRWRKETIVSYWSVH